MLVKLVKTEPERWSKRRSARAEANPTHFAESLRRVEAPEAQKPPKNPDAAGKHGESEV
jgi:hypothetical protein